MRSRSLSYELRRPSNRLAAWKTSLPPSKQTLTGLSGTRTSLLLARTMSSEQLQTSARLLRGSTRRWWARWSSSPRASRPGRLKPLQGKRIWGRRFERRPRVSRTLRNSWRRRRMTTARAPEALSTASRNSRPRSRLPRPNTPRPRPGQLALPMNGTSCPGSWRPRRSTLRGERKQRCSVRSKPRPLLPPPRTTWTHRAPRPAARPTTLSSNSHRSGPSSRSFPGPRRSWRRGNRPSPRSARPSRPAWTASRTKVHGASTSARTMLRATEHSGRRFQAC
mmetsp:Transcript_23437/g.68463  ORF Transcript_23437/g.68463 Transcript_23437/m.68463 type:complete len:279 (-) Transcript_23437:989-1825(-)